MTDSKFTLTIGGRDYGTAPEIETDEPEPISPPILVIPIERGGTCLTPDMIRKNPSGIDVEIPRESQTFRDIFANRPIGANCYKLEFEGAEDKVDSLEVSLRILYELQPAASLEPGWKPLGVS